MGPVADWLPVVSAPLSIECRKEHRTRCTEAHQLPIQSVITKLFQLVADAAVIQDTDSDIIQ